MNDTLLAIPSRYWLLVRYGIVGVTGGIIQTLFLYLWVGVLRLETHYLVGASLGFCCALMVTFTLQKYWTFRDRAEGVAHRQFALYTLIALLNLALTVLLLHASKALIEQSGFDFFDRWYLIAQVTIIVLLAGASFSANYFVTFKRP